MKGWKKTHKTNDGMVYDGIALLNKWLNQQKTELLIKDKIEDHDKQCC